MKLLLCHFETALGSVMHATPIVRAIKTESPNSSISVVASGLAYEALKYNPLVSDIYPVPQPTSHQIKSLVACVGTGLWRTTFDWKLFSAGSSRTKCALATLPLRAKRVGGFCTHKWFVDVELRSDDRLSVIENNLKLLEPLNLNCNRKFKPEIWVSSEDAERALEWRSEISTFGRRGPVIGIFAGTSGGHPNEWQVSRFAQTIATLAFRLEATIVLFGSARDQVRLNQLEQLSGVKTINMAGKTTLTYLAAVLAVCDQIVTVDTGGLHVAWAVGTPTVVIGNAANPPHIWLPPVSPSMRIILKHAFVHCANCRLHHCETRECMDLITVDEVVQFAMDQLKQCVPSPDARHDRLASCVVQS